MTVETHSLLAGFIWEICNLLRGPYRRNEYRKVILPLTVLRRFDCVLAPTKELVLARAETLKGKPEALVRNVLEQASGYPFCNLSRLDFPRLLDAPNEIALNLSAHIAAYSPNVRAIKRAGNYGAVRLRRADRADGREEPALRGDQGLREV